ncbi:MAG: hypothetical protein ACLTMP_09930 [Eggerthella lenta]
MLTKFQLENDLFGDGNRAIEPTMQLIDAQNQAINSAIENSASIDWLVKVAGQSRPEDIAAKRDEFAAGNLSKSNTTGVMAYDNTWENVTPIDRKQYTVDAEQMKLIENNVFNYFGLTRKSHRTSSTKTCGTPSTNRRLSRSSSSFPNPRNDLFRSRACRNAISFMSSAIDYRQPDENAVPVDDRPRGDERRRVPREVRHAACA